MAQRPDQGFTIGQRAWFLDGRSGIIQTAAFNTNALEWQYRLEPLGGPFLESDLFNVNPIVDAPVLEPEIVFVPPAEVGNLINEDTVRAIIGASVAGLLFSRDAALRALQSDLEELINERLADQAETILSLESRIVTQQSEIENRATAQDLIADETGAGGVGGLFRRIGGFVLNPFAAILGAMEEYILSEVRDGLNR